MKRFVIFVALWATAWLSLGSSPAWAQTAPPRAPGTAPPAPPQLMPAMADSTVIANGGLLWNQENAINRGVRAHYTKGPLALSFAWTDGFFSNRYSWLLGSATYSCDSSNSVTSSVAAA